MGQNITNSTKENTEEKATFVGEEGDIDSVSETAGKDFVAAIFIAGLSILAMILAYQLHSPDTIYTSPGLLPFLTGLTLLIMSISLGISSHQRGGTKNVFKFGEAIKKYFQNLENLRTLLLIGIVVVYITVLNMINFDLRLPTSFFVFRFSSYELCSIISLTLILKIFWKASLLRCFIVSLIWIVALTSVFRYGFHILLPGSG